MLKRHFKSMLLLSLCALSVISPQLVHHSLIMGADSLFHFNRFYDAASQINDHNWQYFVSMYGFSQSGRIVNALYGPFIAYFNGFILGLTHSWFSYQIISDFIVLFVSGISMYYLLIQNYVSKQYQVVSSYIHPLYVKLRRCDLGHWATIFKLGRCYPPIGCVSCYTFRTGKKRAC